MTFDFPKLPGYQATWAPVYFEPIVGSGERVVCALVARGLDGAVASQNVFDAIRGGANMERVAELKTVGERVRESLETHIRQGGNFDSWTPLFSRLTVGSGRVGLGEDIWEVLQHSLNLTSSWHHVHGKALEREQVVTKIVNWRKAIRQSATLKHPAFAKCFSKSFRISEQARPIEVDFIGRRAAYYFGHLASGRSLQDTVNAAKAKLFNLEELRDFCDRMDDLGGKLQQGFSFRLMLRLAGSDQEEHGVQEAIYELQLAAKRRDLGLETANSPEEACSLLLTREAA